MIRLVKAAFIFAVHPLAILCASAIWAYAFLSEEKSNKKITPWQVLGFLARVVVFPFVFAFILITYIPKLIFGFITEPINAYHTNSYTPSYLVKAKIALEKIRHPERYTLSSKGYLDIKTLMEKKVMYTKTSYFLENESYFKLIFLLNLETTSLQRFGLIKSKPIKINTQRNKFLNVELPEGIDCSNIQKIGNCLLAIRYFLHVI